MLDAIARAILGDEPVAPVTLGSVSLRPHQEEALRRVRCAIEEFGGALLADEPGLGKTFVALALAREYASTVVASPAALRPMWREAAAAATVSVTFVSLETLSRRDVEARGELVIVDEAHHVHSPGAARYARLARLAAGAAVLLLTATPVRNRRGELSALLALFLGPRAGTLDQRALSRLIVRRTAAATTMPMVVGPLWHDPPRTPDLSRAIRSLPSALSALDGREARALVAMTLARCWASSLAALDAALRRRLQRGAALEAALDAGRLPTRAELRSWVIGDDAVQLAFPSIAASSIVDAAGSSIHAAEMRATLRLHLDAVTALRKRIAPCVLRDVNRRAAFLRSLCERHAGRRIMAFTGYAATAEAVYRALGRPPQGGGGVALLTARGARTAGGRRPRADVIRALSSAALPLGGAADDISLVIATDVLSEGVNLQGASVVVHLDVPWTPAGLEQRVGRAARIGSTHHTVHVHGIAPPRPAERLLALGRRFTHKNQIRAEALRAASVEERIRSLVRPWRLIPASPAGQMVAVAAGRIAGFVAVMERGGEPVLVSGTRDRRSSWRVSNRPGDLAAILDSVRQRPVRVSTPEIARVRRAVDRWLGANAARERSGLVCGPTSRARRRILAQLDSLLERAPLHARGELSSRIERARSLVTGCTGAGAELLLARLASSDALGDARWLAALTSSCVAVHGRQPRAPSDQPYEMVALLFLRRPGKITAPAPSLSPGPASPSPPAPPPASPPSASSGTAAIR